MLRLSAGCHRFARVLTSATEGACYRNGGLHRWPINGGARTGDIAVVDNVAAPPFGRSHRPGILPEARTRSPCVFLSREVRGIPGILIVDPCHAGADDRKVHILAAAYDFGDRPAVSVSGFVFEKDVAAEYKGG